MTGPVSACATVALDCWAYTHPVAGVKTRAVLVILARVSPEAMHFSPNDSHFGA